MIVAFDFDNTIFHTTQGLQIGQPIPAVVNTLKRLYNEGNTIVIYSGRPSEEIIKVLKEHEIPFHRVNEHEGYKTPSGKPYYHVLVDDKNVNPSDRTEDELYDMIMSLGKLQQNLEGLASTNESYIVNEIDLKRLAAAGAIGFAALASPMMAGTADAQPAAQHTLFNKADLATHGSHFKFQEFACKHCGKIKVDPKLIEKLEKLRSKLGGHKMTITSGYRCPEHNKAVGGAVKSQHMEGKAADIKVEGYTPAEVAKAAQGLGFSYIEPTEKTPSWTHVDVR